jgi:hypothetical protein
MVHPFGQTKPDPPFIRQTRTLRVCRDDARQRDGGERDARAGGRVASRVGRDLDAIVVNGVLPRRFSNQEVGRVVAAAENTGNSTDARVLATAAGAAQTIYRRAQVQRSQIARLRRRATAGDAGGEVITVPFAFVSELDLSGLDQIAARIRRS